jgi:hypothetical protein
MGPDDDLDVDPWWGTTPGVGAVRDDPFDESSPPWSSSNRAMALGARAAADLFSDDCYPCTVSSASGADAQREGYRPYSSVHHRRSLKSGRLSHLCRMWAFDGPFRRWQDGHPARTSDDRTP